MKTFIIIREINGHVKKNKEGGTYLRFVFECTISFKNNNMIVV